MENSGGGFGGYWLREGVGFGRGFSDMELHTALTRQHPEAGEGGALSNPVWFIFIVNVVQYEYNWIRLHQLTYLVRFQKWIKMGPSSRVFQLLNPFQAVFF